MALELVLLGALIFVFIVSFCGLLQKIRQTYERERLLAERIARRREMQRTQRTSTDSFDEVYINPTFDSTGVFPTAAAPPPYTRHHAEPPPKYDEVVKVHQANGNQSERRASQTQQDTGPPPYTITVTLVTENGNRY